MKTLVVLFVSVVALVLGGCAEQPLMSDEQYNATRGPAPNAPDYSGYLPQPSNRPPGY
jgi:outer membrane lipoprotein SlyB